MRHHSERVTLEKTDTDRRAAAGLKLQRKQSTKPHVAVVSLTCFHHAGQSVAETRGLGSEYFHIVVHSAEQVCDEDGVNVRSHERFQGRAGN